MLYQLSYQSEVAATRDRTRDLQIFSLTLSQLSYSGERASSTSQNKPAWSVVVNEKGSSTPKRGHGGIEPPTSPTLKENHTTRPMPRAARICKPPSYRFSQSGSTKVIVLGMGFEPTPPKRLELESSALDRSAIQACHSQGKHGDTKKSWKAKNK